MTLRGACVLAVLLGCGGPAEPGPTRPTVLVSVVGGGAQEARVGEELPEPVVIRATDAQSAAVAGQLINFVVATGGGHVFAGSAQTNAQGEARERWTLGTVAGEQVLEARAVDQ